MHVTVRIPPLLLQQSRKQNLKQHTFCVQVLGVLAGELGGLVEGSLRAAERCAVIEALLYLQVG